MPILNTGYWINIQGVITDVSLSSNCLAKEAGNVDIFQKNLTVISDCQGAQSIPDYDSNSLLWCLQRRILTFFFISNFPKPH